MGWKLPSQSEVNTIVGPRLLQLKTILLRQNVSKDQLSIE